MTKNGWLWDELLTAGKQKNNNKTNHGRMMIKKKVISFSSRSLLFNKAPDFALTKAGKDSNFKLKTEQKSIIEAVICLFVCLFLCVCGFFCFVFVFVFFFHTICQDCNFPKEFPANFVARTCSISPLCLSFSSGFSFIPRFRKY